MRKFSATLLAGAFIALGGCATAGSGSATAAKAANPGLSAAIKQTEANLAEVKKAGFEWRLLDKAAGKKSVPLSKLMKLAKAAADKGDEAEARRLLDRINFAAKMGMKQHDHPGKVFYPPR